MKLLTSLLRATIPFSLSLALLIPMLDAAEKGPQTVQVSIGTILASNESDNFDPRLSKMKSQLEVIKYRSYRLLREQVQKAPWQSSAAFEIPGGRSLTVIPEGYRNNRLSLKVRLLQGEKPLLDTTVQLRNRGNFLLGGPAHEGGVLILSISATTQ
ncbi:MAG: hypothetical protein E6J89_04675 [Deltaproteobacteria bacterium]|nr:MAG: hypothetical protein E6J89_04675 [Deltaproteobacteria bacterium]